MFYKEKILSIITTITLLIFGYAIIHNNSYYMEDKIDQLSNEMVQSQALVLERSITQSTVSAVILRKHLQTVKGDMSDFNNYAKDLYNLLGGITNLQLAPQGIVSKIYPLKGHEKAIGHDIFNSDARKKEAFLAKESKKLTVAGPFTLMQGGVAIIARSPIYLQNENSEKEFWGFASTLVYLDDLLKTTDLYQLKEKKYLFRLWRYHPDTNKIDIFAGEKNLPKKNVFTKNIKVPNSEWYLDIVYIGSSFSMLLMYTFYVVNILVSLLLGYLMYIILIKPKELEKEVALKTHELNLINSQLLKLNNAVTYNSNAIFMANASGNIEYINPAFEQMTGYSFNDILKGETKLFQDELNHVLKHNNQWSTQNTYEKKNKELFVSIITISVVNKANGDIDSFVGVCEDITEKIKNEESIQEKEILIMQQSKMAAMGEMLENIAHQWRQPLSSISSAASGLKLQHEYHLLTDEKWIVLVDGIIDATEYLTNTITDFNNYFKPRKEITLCNSIDLIDKVLNMLVKQYQNIQIEIVKDIEDVEFNSYQNELVQVLVNIFNNAKDQLMQVKNERNLILINIFKNDSKLIIKIKDNGGGIPSDVINRIFEPYFTTKDKSLGTGIGLYMSQKIISKHLNGELIVKNNDFTYENKKYRGAEFSIILELA